ncbi:MAG: hypothetical protein ACQGQO_01465 [Sphaerochaetaceae bacterium]
MGRIKTSLELAMERMEDIQVDENKIRQDNLRQDARSIAGKYLEDDTMQDDELEARLSKYEGSDLTFVTKTINETILQNLSMPSAIEYKMRNKRIASLFPIVNDGNSAAIKVITQILSLEDQYWDTMSGLLDKMKEQYKDAISQSDAPAEQNKDFLNMYQANVKQINQQYGSVLTRGKTQLSAMLGL